MRFRQQDGRVHMLEVRLLGPVEILIDGRPSELSRPQQRAVLAVLAVEAGRPVPAEVLLNRVWGDEPPKGALATLYSHITRTRQALKPGAGEAGPAVLLRQPAGYVLDLDLDRITCTGSGGR
jgi:DNA-binding SARP family transcriptional activator